MEAVLEKENEKFLEGVLNLKHLPAYAKFLLENKLVDYIKEQLRLATKIDLPLMKYFVGMTEEQLIALSIESNTEFLTHIIDNNLDALITKSMRQWKENDIPLINSDQIQAEDLTYTGYMRKEAFARFLPEYTNDLQLGLAILAELEEYTLKSQTIAIKFFIESQYDKLDKINVELKKNEGQLLEAQEIANMGSFEWDLVEHNSTFSPQFGKILDIETGGNLNTFLEYVHEDDREKVRLAIEKALNKSDLYEAEYRYVKGGVEKVIWSRGYITFKDDKPHHMTGTIMDVTQRTNIMKRLSISEERYQRMVGEVQDYAIISLSKEGEIQNWNLGAEKIKGYKADEIVGKNFSIFYTEKDRIEHLPEKLLAEAIKSGRANHEGWRVRKNGTTFWGNIVLTALHNDKQEIIGFSKVTRDLTERKISEDRLLKYMDQLEVNEKELVALNRSLEQKNTELERNNQELTSFNYVASHDLQEPLRKIRTFSSLISETESERLTEKGTQLLGKIHAASGRMQQLIEDLLAYSRTNITNEQFEPVDLDKIMDESRNGYEDLITSGQLTIAYDKLPMVTGLNFQLQQLFNNILANSIKYRKAGIVSHINVSAEVIAGSTEPFVDALPDRNYYKISIVDNGIGFDQQYADKIFDIFQRLHTTSEYQGTGIGLAICKKIVQNHHGAITAKSTIGEGAEFNVFLPA